MKILILKKKRKHYTTLYLYYSDTKTWEPLNLQLIGNREEDKKTMALAEQIKAEKVLEYAANGQNIIRSNKDFLEYYKQVIDERPVYERRSSVYKHLMNYCRLNNIKTLTFSDINEGFWYRFKSYLVNDCDHKQVTVHTVFGIMKTILYRAERERLIPRMPLRGIKEKKPRGTRTYLTVEEMKILDKTPCAYDSVKQAFFFSCYTGLRISDIRNLKRKSFAHGAINLVMKKTGDSLILPYSELIFKYMPNLDGLKDEDYIFSLPVSSTVSVVMRSWVQAAKIQKNITFHSGRHTYATLHLTYGTSIEVLRDLLGHKNIKETQIYAKIIDEKKRQATGNLPEI